MTESGMSLYMLGIAICFALGLVFALINWDYNKRRSLAWAVLPLLGITTLCLTKYVSNLDSYWQVSTSGKYEKLPQSLWWRNQFNQKVNDMTIRQKRTAEKAWVVVFQNSEAYQLEYGVSTLEEETKMLESTGLRALKLPGYPAGVAERLVVQAFGRHGTNLTELARDLSVNGITSRDLSPITNNQPVGRQYRYY